MAFKFTVDQNVGKLARWLRMMGCDAELFTDSDDGQMVAGALAGGRVILTRDTDLMRRRVIAGGQLKALLISSEKPAEQIRQVLEAYPPDSDCRPFSRCLECNQPLVARSRDEVKDRVPPYVFKTQQFYMECLACRRIYWRGTHWEAMTRWLEKLGSEAANS